MGPSQAAAAPPAPVQIPLSMVADVRISKAPP